MVLHARLPSLLLVFFLAAPAFAQPTLSIHQPTLTVNSRHVEVEGAPLSQVPFTYFFLNVPKVGEFIIAAHRFEGSTKAGLFNGGYLEFELAGSHVQLWSSATILNIHDIVDAYVRLDDHVARDGDIARLSLTSSGQPAQQVAERRDVSTNQEARYIPIEGNRSDLSRQVDQLRDQSSMLTSQIERLRAEKAYLETQLTTDQSLADSLRRELTTQRVALETSNGDLESEVDQLRRQNAELLQRVRSLRAEVERHDRERGGLRVEREAIASVRQANRQPESV
ncbi:MAG: hypothetical protein R3284_05720 [Rubricoccaceae bacterium]|nr:hypothetical protein [Rubricoccaceae bacterium]